MQFNKEKLTVLVIGLGRFGRTLCAKLSELGVSVIGVDRARSTVEELSDSLDCVAQLDATDENALIKIGAGNVDVAIVALGEKMEGSILATAILRDLGVPRIIARSDSALHSRILTRVGAHEVVNPEAEMGQRVAEILVNPWLNHFTELEDGEIIVGVISPLAEMLGKTIMELQFTTRYNALIMLMEREGRKFIPKADVTLETHDKIWIFGLRKDLCKIIAQTEAETKKSSSSH